MSAHISITIIDPTVKQENEINIQLLWEYKSSQGVCLLELQPCGQTKPIAPVFVSIRMMLKAAENIPDQA